MAPTGVVAPAPAALLCLPNMNGAAGIRTLSWGPAMWRRCLIAATTLVWLDSGAAAQTTSSAAPEASAGSLVSSKVVVGVPEWPSAKATANIIKVVLEDRFGVAVELKAMSSDEIFAGMDAGTVHAHPEVWHPNLDALRKTYVNDRGTVRESRHTVSASQGLCTTRQTAEELDVRSVDDLADRSKAVLFDTDLDSKGEMWIGDPSWTSTQIERIRARSYGYDDTMTLLEAPEEVALAGIDAAIAVGRPIVFYCYRPHYLFELHDVVALKEPAHDPAKWRIAMPVDDPDWLAKSTAPVAWPDSHFRIDYAAALADSLPEAAQLLDAIALDASTVSQMSYALVVERKEPYAFAQEWVNAHDDLVSSWVEDAKR
jgi:glycine betaine/proline transport system substrate-binding protein